MTDLAERAFQLLANRNPYETRQRLYSQLVQDGLRRRNKPWPTAADLHFPLIDCQITQLKPFWVAQAFGGQRLCDFRSMRKDDLAADAESGADFFDFTMRNKTNYRVKFETAVFFMLLRGRGVLKAVTNPFKDYRIEFEAPDPLFILIGEEARDFEDADEFVHVKRLSVPQYKRNRNYTQTDAVIGAIRGKPDYNFEAIIQDKQQREGITHSPDKDVIILWEHWVKTMGGWTIHTYSPMAQQAVVRKPYGCPYKVNGEPSCPYFSIPQEIKDEGWFSPRGIAELNASFEQYACKLWNEKTDAMTFGNRPLFTSDGEIQNAANLRFLPGEFIPGNIKAVQMAPPAYSFSEEINFTREIAEQRAKLPDFGISRDDGQGDKTRTATENNRIAGLQDVGTEHNGAILREVLERLYKHCWGLMVQFQPKQVAYFVSNDLKELPVQALHNEYLIQPDGAAGTKQQRLQTATNRFLMFKGDPGIDQDELKKDVLAADDSRLIHKLLIPMNQKQQSEAFQEDVELMVLAEGRSVPVLPGQDHAVRIMEDLGYLHSRAVLGHEPDPMAVQTIQKHMMEHFAYLKATQPQAAKQILQQIQGMEQQATGAQQGQNGAPQQQNPQQTGTNGGGAQPANGEVYDSVSAKLPDFYPSERMQILDKQYGIKGASLQEIQQVEVAKAQLKQMGNPKPKINGETGSAAE